MIEAKTFSRLEQIDGLRGIAAAMVTWFHMTNTYSEDSWVRASGTFGFLGVEIFFVISGFIIPWSMNRAGYTIRTGFGSFLTKRVLRIEPPRLLAISWGDSEVTFELEPRGTQVLFTVTHRRLADRAKMVQSSGGWHAHLEILTERLNGRVPKAFWTVFGDIESQYEKRYPK